MNVVSIFSSTEGRGVQVFELMKSKFVSLPSVVCRPSVASIISEVTAWIAFKFHLWLSLGHMPKKK